MVPFLARALFTLLASAALCTSRARLLLLKQSPPGALRDELPFQRHQGLHPCFCPLRAAIALHMTQVLGIWHLAEQAKAASMVAH